MLDLDLMDSVAGLQIYDLGRQEGEQEGRERGMLEEAQEMLIEGLQAHFAFAPPDLVERIKQIEERQVLKSLLKQAIRCKDLDEFREALDGATAKE